MHWGYIVSFRLARNLLKSLDYIMRFDISNKKVGDSVKVVDI